MHVVACLSMSSLTTISGSMEESLEDQLQVVVDTRLSLVIGGGAVDRMMKRPASCSDDEEEDGAARKSTSSSKKLRLTGEQATLLERSFNAHNILSHGEKHDLARRLGLRPRQVEVWFQNRRARTKLKQTEIDRELLQRWCDRLSHENARLRREIADARCSSPSCPSCRSKLAAG